MATKKDHYERYRDGLTIQEIFGLVLMILSILDYNFEQPPVAILS